MSAGQSSAPAEHTAITQIPDTHKGPKKPEITSASLEDLVGHYNSQVTAYNAAVALLAAKSPKATGLEEMAPIATPELAEQVGKPAVIELIRRQNRRLGRTVRRRALELLEMRIKGEDGKPMTDRDGRSIGLKYKEVLGIIKTEFPEASTSVACLRWYVVHLRMDANDAGLPWPDLPQIRPRAKGKEKGE